MAPTKSILLGVLIGAIIASEFAHREERSSLPVDESQRLLLAHRVWPSKTVEGKKHLLVFLHGWPDDMNLFERLATGLSTRFHCVSCNLPGYPVPKEFEHGNKGTVPERKWGFGFDEALILLKSTIEILKSEGDYETVTLITHDWGCVVGYLMDQAYPSLVNRMVSVDVGWRLNGPTVKGLLYTLLYQGFLNLCFILPSPIGTYLTYRLSCVLRRHPAPTSGPVSSLMNWPYRSAWREMFTKGTIKKMDKYRPSPKPRLFIYAQENPEEFRFADDKWNQAVLDSCKGVSKVQALRGGHWMMHRNSAEFEKLVEDWLVTSASHMKQ